MEEGLISVDKLSKGSQAYFLTHFHADNVCGLSCLWSNGLLFCSRTTAKILAVKVLYSVSDIEFDYSKLGALSIGVWYPLSLISPSTGAPTSVQVMAIDSLHCPGSVMYLFRGDFGHVLYTGNFRWELTGEKSEKARNMLLNALNGQPVDVLHLDNHYCNPAYNFPTRDIAAQEVIEIIQSHPEHDVIIGVNSLGKEELLLRIADYFKIKFCEMENRKQKENSDAAQTRRVKVYRQAQDGKGWEDQGTGYVSVDYMERSEDLALFVIDEEDNETLLSHKICPDDIYRKQEDTIISWKDPEISSDLALSFQESAGCCYIWDHICNAQRNLHFGNLNHDTFHSENSKLGELPAVELSTLPSILKIVVESGITDQMRLTELVLHDQEFLRKLMNLFRICEDLKDIDSLHMIYKIVKGIVMLNSSQILEILFGDEFIMDIIGCLEYDPEVPHILHRDFLTEHVVFKEAIPIKDPMVLSKIHQTYRIGNLKDVVLPKVLDDATIASLNSIVHANNGVVVSLLKEDSLFIQELFSKLKSASTSVVSKKNLVYFLREFCSLSKSLPMVQQLRLFRDLVNEGLFDIISDILQSEDKRLVLTGTDILILFLNQDPNLLRSYVVRPEGTPLLGLLVQGMLTDFGDDMHCQFLEILRTLLDSYTLSGSQRDAIIDIFYEKHLTQLIDVITSSCTNGGGNLGNFNGANNVTQRNTKPEILLNICELLCFCVVHHPYRIKCNFLLNNLMDKVLFLTRRREKYLVVAAVRFVRTVISRNVSKFYPVFRMLSYKD